MYSALLIYLDTYQVILGIIEKKNQQILVFLPYLPNNLTCCNK